MAVKSCLCTLAENGSSLTFDSFGFHFIRCLSTDIVDKDSCLPLSQDAIALTFHCHVAVWEIPWHQCFTAQLIDAVYQRTVKTLMPTCNMC
ncbi:hypothetical protein ACB092_03G057000 [Castanea dentata]